MPSKDYNGQNPLGEKRSQSFAQVELQVGRLQPALSLQSGSLQTPNGRIPTAQKFVPAGGIACKNLTVTKSRPASVYDAPPDPIPENTGYVWVNIGSVDNVLPTNMFSSFSFDTESSETYYVYLECTLASTEFKAETSEIKISTTEPPKTSGTIGSTDTRPEKYNFILAYILKGGVLTNTGCGDISTELYATTTTTGTTTTVAARRLS